MNPALARPIGNRGPWVSPGNYTVTVASNGAEASTTVEVRGDPDMPITLAMYQSRERFMLEALALSNEIRAYMRENGMGGSGGGRGGFGRGGGAPLNTPAGKLSAAMRAAQGAYGSLNGRQVRGGSLYPPTRSHRDQLQLAKDLFAEVRGVRDP